MADNAGRNSLRIAGAILLWTLTALPAHAQSRTPITYGDIEITLEGVPQGSSWHGYCEYVFRIHNKSTERPHTVGVVVPFEKGFVYGDYIRELQRTVSVGANETVRLSLFQPDHPPLGGRNAAVILDGRRSENDVQFKPNETQSRGGRFSYYRYSAPSHGLGEPLLLIGARVGTLPTLAPIMAPAMPGGMMPPPGMPGIPGMAARMEEPIVKPVGPPPKPGLPPNSHQPVNPEPVEMWSSNWLAYSRYDGVVVTADELKSMSASVRSALWQYVETGGFLFVIGPADLRGLSAVSEVETDRAGWKSIRSGFGLCLVSPNADYGKWDNDHFKNLAAAWGATLSTWQSGHRSTLEANQEFPVVEDLGIPVRGLFVLMFLFTLTIGPINFLVLSHLKRRIWLLWTTPVISLATCLAVFGFMLISEGWEGRLRTETLTLLDETTHRATTIGWTGVYSPLTPGDGLHFSYDTEVIPQRFFEEERGQSRSCTLDWSRDQHFASGWVEARVPSLFKVRKSEMRRERVNLNREADGSWSMVNGLSVEIRRFCYADDAGQIYEAENVAAGARVKLSRSEKEIQALTMNLGSLLSSSNWMNGMQQLAANPQRYLRPGEYLAEVDDSPFLEDALRNARKRKAHALVVGFHQKGE
jgi:hypothetical protein